MKYEEIAQICEQLDYRDKLRLAQLLIQLARKEEENQNPKKRTNLKKVDASSEANDEFTNDVGSIEYVAERLLKLKPAKRKSLENSVKAMFQFQGGISKLDEKKVVSELQRLNYITIDSNNRVTYL